MFFFKKGPPRYHEVALEAIGKLKRNTIDDVLALSVYHPVRIPVQNIENKYDMKLIDDLYYLDDRVGQVNRGRNEVR